MPYIQKDLRPILDTLSKPLIDHLKSLPEIDQDGCLNYTISQIIRQIYPKKYFHFNRALGVLSAISLELYRHRIGPYEDEKIDQNGDLT